MHLHSHDRLVKIILKIIAKEQKQSYKKVKNRFAFQADTQVTQWFWDILHSKHPHLGHHEVFHCTGCDKFELE